MATNSWLPRFPLAQKALVRVAGKASFLRYRQRLSAASVSVDPVTPQMEPQALEGYTNSHFYHPGQTISFYLKANLTGNLLELQFRTENNDWNTIATHSFQKIPQPETLDEAQHGCGWQVSWTHILPTTAPQGYYRALLSNSTSGNTSQIHFIVGAATADAKVVVLAPVTTWLAYNAYGGQSLYRNALVADPVPYVSALRPNTALTYQHTHSMQHNLQIEANIFGWMKKHHQANLLPDYYLEAQPQLLEQYQVIVLAYHAEYFSKPMYQTLRNLVWQKHKSLLALGGNQVYWQVRWHQNFSQLECRKDASFFQGIRQRGKLFRHTTNPEAQLLGVQFSEAGLGTYAPYQAMIPAHWLFEGLKITPGHVFGQEGIDGKPICGDETDKTTWASPGNTVMVAKGLNKTTSTAVIDIYDATDSQWDGSGGGEIAITEISDHHAVLATGSIQSGAGLGKDNVFTGLVQNFMQRYAGSASRGTTA